MSNISKTYSFKAVGQLQNDFSNQKDAAINRTAIGIKTPIAFSNGTSDLFNMNYDISDQIRDNLRNLVSTNEGERLMLSDFGANLRPLVLEFSNEDVVNEAIRRISKSAAKFMPYVELETFESKIQPTTNGSTVGVVIRVGYSVPSIGATKQAVETIIYVAG